MTSSDWIFGYGSLVWRPAFAFEERRPAYIRGFARRFWQASTDHRGTPEAPGRVVTLITEHSAECWGAAYRLPVSGRSEILAQLDHREKGGYERHNTPLYFQEAAEPSETLVYVATEQNRNYLGPAPLEAIAEQVRRSKGPSGANPEYVLELAAALREMGAQDDHVFALEALLLER